MKLREVFRAASFDASTLDEENRTVDLAFSSEQPVEQYFGREILSHDPGAMDTTRLDNGAPLLLNHSKGDRSAHVGVVEPGTAHIGADRKGRAKVRFSRSTAGAEAMQDVKDGILRNVSVGYRIKDMKQTGGTRQNPEYTVTKWMPTEISLVTVPADHTVGVGRADTSEECEVNVTRDDNAAAAAISEKGTEMTTEEKMAAEAARAREAEARDALRADAMRAERERIAAITALGAKFNKGDLARQLIEGGKDLDAARAAFLEAIGYQEREAKPVAEAGSVLDLTDKEKGQYSIIRALNAQISGDWKKAGFERECSVAIGQRMQKDTEGFFFPVNLPVDRKLAEAARTTSGTAYQVGTAGAGTTGGTLVATNLLASSFIEVLRNKAKVMQLGARMLSGLVGNVAIPRQTSQTPTYWVSPEGADLTEGEAAFDLISLTPKTMGAYSQITRQLLMQSTPDIEMLVRDDLAQVMALGIDLATLTGTGASGQPTGILNTSGIGSVAMGTNGAAFTNLDPLIDLETSLTGANVAEENLYYLTNAKVVGALKKLKDSNGRYLWTQYPGVFGQRTPTPGEVNGYPVARTNQMPSNFTKGTGTNLSGMIFGNWGELLIGEWGVMEILPNPYGAGFKSGTIEIRALQTVDVAVRHAKSFAAITDIIA